MLNTSEPSSRRKPFNDCAGYVASRRNEINRGWVVIYRAAEQGLDDSGGKYVVVCERHSTLCNFTSIPACRPCLIIPDFCEACMADMIGETLDDDRAAYFRHAEKVYENKIHGMGLEP